MRLLAAVQLLGQGHHVFGEEFPGELLLAGVVAVKGALGYLCRAGDIFNSSGVNPFFHEEPQSGFIDQLFGLTAISCHSEYSLIIDNLFITLSPCPCQAIFEDRCHEANF